MDSCDSGSSAEIVNPSDCDPSSTNGDHSGKVDQNEPDIDIDENGKQERLKVLEKDGWMDVLDCGDLLRKIIRPGASPSEDTEKTLNETRPGRNQLVTVKFVGKLVGDHTISGQENEGPVVDEHDRLEFQLGTHEVIDAVEMCVQLMHLGEIDSVRTTARFAYGSLGRDPDIPPDSSLIYEIELISARDAPDLGILPSADVVAYLERRKTRGNYFYSRGDWHRALTVYDQTVEAMKGAFGLETEPKDAEPSTDKSGMWSAQYADIAAAVYSNIAATALKTDDAERALAACSACLRLQPNNTKALYRRGKAAAAMLDWVLAVNSFDCALALEPDSKLIAREAGRARRRLQQQRDHERRLCARMVAAAGAGDAWAEMGDRSRLAAFIRQNAMLLLACVAAIIAVIWYVSGLQQYFTPGAKILEPGLEE